MRTLNSVAAAAAVCLVLLFSQGTTQAQCTAGTTLLVGPSDQYAFQWCDGVSATSIGLEFASSDNEYQFKRVSGGNLMTLNPTAGAYVRMGDPDAGNYTYVDADGDLRFNGTADLLIANNAYAFRSVGDEDNGLFFNVSLNQYEFRSNVAGAGLAIKANDTGADESGDLVGQGSATFEDEIVAGNNVLFASAAVKGMSGNAPTNGYLGVIGTLDFDGIVGLDLSTLEIGALGLSTGGSATDNYGIYGYSNGVGGYAEHSVSGYSASLATTDYGLDVNGPSNLGGQLVVSASTFPTNSASAQGPLYVKNSGLFGGSYGLGFDGNEIQSYNGDTAAGTLFLNYWGGAMDVINGSVNPNGTLNVGSGNLWVSNSTDRVGIGTTAPSGRLGVTSTDNIETMYLTSTGSPTEMVDIERTGAAMTSSQDIINIDAPAGSSTTAQFIEASVGGVVEFQVNTNGHIGAGTAASSLYAIQACGTIRATEVIVETGWCDYVFEDDYNLMDLKEVANYIEENKHLPGIPAASVVESEGMPVAEMSANFMEKIEELTLYTIEQDRQIDDLNAQIDELKSLIKGMQE